MTPRFGDKSVEDRKKAARVDVTFGRVIKEEEDRMSRSPKKLNIIEVDKGKVGMGRTSRRSQVLRESSESRESVISLNDKHKKQVSLQLRVKDEIVESKIKKDNSPVK